VVCSAHEIAALRQRFGRQLRLVVPGIRADGEAAGDQKRTMAPAEAMALGADVLVIGRPITRAEAPRLAAEALARGLARAA
jgi:orotidine-5'-phosphate decarboxylase